MVKVDTTKKPKAVPTMDEIRKMRVDNLKKDDKNVTSKEFIVSNEKSHKNVPSMADI